jgi:hypothetical protein
MNSFSLSLHEGKLIKFKSPIEFYWYSHDNPKSILGAGAIAVLVSCIRSRGGGVINEKWRISDGKLK